MKQEPKNPQGNFLKRNVNFLWLFGCFAVIAFCIIFTVGMTSSIPHPFGKMFIFAWLYAVCWALTGALLIFFIRWVWCWRNFKRFLFGVACLITLVALFYVEEDWRGRYDWESYKHQGAAKGEKFAWMDFAPAPVPDDENFAMSPVWIARIKYNFRDDLKKAEAWYGDRVDSDDASKFLPLMPISSTAIVGTNEVNSPVTPELPVRWTTARTMDLKPWQSYYRDLEEKHPDANVRITPQPQSPAADVLLALSKFDPAVNQLQKDSERPDSRFPVQYDVDDPAEILLPHLAAVKQTAQVLELRALAELQNGQTDQAAVDVKLMLRLVDSIRTEPFIITHLVRMVVMQMAIQCIYEGLAEHKWSDAQLAEMDSELAKINYPADFQFCVRAETAGHAQIFQWIAQNRSRGSILLDIIYGNGKPLPESDQRLLGAELYLMPKGWFYQGDLILADHGQIWSSMSTGDAHQTISPRAVLQASNAAVAMLDRHPAPFVFIGRLLTPELSNYAKRTAFAQESADLARIAIALERYYLANGGYPASLDALAPKFMQEIPMDVINGEPLQYRATQDGRFVLYSVGWNEKDDGGVAIPVKGSIGTGVDVDKGDWVWRYPEK